MHESGPVEPRAALQRAVGCLTQGAFDGRSVDGAQANALEAIAWALIGLLQTQTASALAPSPGRIAPMDRHEPARALELARPSEATIVETLERAGFVTIKKKDAKDGGAYGRVPPF